MHPAFGGMVLDQGDRAAQAEIANTTRRAAFGRAAALPMRRVILGELLRELP
jgi:hypothetical protein